MRNYFLWSKNTPEAYKQLLNLPLTSAVPIRSIQMNFPTSVTEHPQSLQLQLRQRFFMITDCSELAVISFFESSPEIGILMETFSGKNKDQNVEQTDSSLKQGIIKISPLNNQTQSISFQFQCSQQKLIELYRTFPKTYTIQLNFHQLFKPLRKIGQGATSIVYQVRRILDNARLAVKAFKKSTYYSLANGRGKQAFYNEFRVLCECQHPGICRFEGTFQSDNSIYIVQEYYEKSLSCLVKSSGDLPRKQVLSLMQDLLCAISYLHAQGIFHRDIKLENIMLKKQNNQLKPVFIDLGMAQYADNNEYIFDKCGTPGFIAPQVFQAGAKNKKGDIFSLGVIFYILLFKAPVFSGQDKEQVIQNNRKGKMNLDHQRLNQEDKLIKDLLLKMLQVDLTLRITAEEALQHQVFQIKTSQSPLTSVGRLTSDRMQDIDLLE